MKSKTLKELRELAGKLGLTGVSHMTKDVLLRKLAAKKSPVSVRASTKKSTSAKPKTAAKSARPKTVAPVSSIAVPSWNEPARGPNDGARLANDEYRVERAKYALRADGVAATSAPVDLLEDIDHLPTLNEPMLCLLPQKPGVLHAYWVVPDGGPARTSFKLRLCRVDGTALLAVVEEIALPATRGSWYFHVPETLGNHEAIVQLGYERDGTFVSAMTRGVTSPPTRFASNRTDRAWWVSEEDFRHMYLRAGGIVAAGRRYGWSAFGSSRGAVTGEQERPAHPGSVSSQPK